MADGVDDKGGQVYVATDKGHQLSQQLGNVMAVLGLGERDACIVGG